MHQPKHKSDCDVAHFRNQQNGHRQNYKEKHHWDIRSKKNIATANSKAAANKNT